MPNGHSGGFQIHKTDLEQLFKDLPGQSVIGSAMVRRPDGPPSWADVDAAAAMSILSAFKGMEVWVEEQDAAWYILHLDHEVQERPEPQGEKWIVIASVSPLFGPLRDCHRREQIRIKRLLDDGKI